MKPQINCWNPNKQKLITTRKASQKSRKIIWAPQTPFSCAGAGGLSRYSFKRAISFNVLLLLFKCYYVLNVIAYSLDIASRWAQKKATFLG